MMRGPVRFGIVGPTKLASEALCASARDGARYEVAAILAGDTRYESYCALLQRKAIDAVYLGAPGVQGFEYVSAALDAGIHVLCEDAIAASPAQWAALASAPRRRAPVQLASRALFCPARHAAAVLARSGKLGEVRSLSAVVCARDASCEALMLECVGYARRLFDAEPIEVLAATRSLHPDVLSVAFLFPGEQLALIACGFDRPPSSRYDVHASDGDLRLCCAPGETGHDELLATVADLPLAHRFARSRSLEATLERFADCVLEHGVRNAGDAAAREAEANVHVLEAIQRARVRGRCVHVKKTPCAPRRNRAGASSSAARHRAVAGTRIAREMQSARPIDEEIPQ